MLKIRLRRMGSRHRPFYRVVVSDSRRVPTAAALEELGYYDPRVSPSLFKVDLEKLDAWLAKGAQPSDTVKQLVKKARRAITSGEQDAAGGAPAEAGAAPEQTAEAPAESSAEEAAAAGDATAEDSGDDSATAAADVSEGDDTAAAETTDNADEKSSEA
ncbi:MAG: 30S ribosomal protein S16 [Holophagales bacterium]|nr:30S ribosomal protein S16 [Holophagales bacterium]